MSDKAELMAEYRAVKANLSKMEQSRARAELRGDHAIAHAYDGLINDQKRLLTNVERRLYKALANDNML